MSVQFTDERHVAMYDSVTGRAFGPTFETQEQAEDFVAWLDERGLRVGQLLSPGAIQWGNLHDAWFAERVDGETGELHEEKKPWCTCGVKTPHGRYHLTGCPAREKAEGRA